MVEELTDSRTVAASSTALVPTNRLEETWFGPKVTKGRIPNNHTYLKLSLRLIKQNLVRLLVIAGLTLISVAISSGLAVVPTRIRDSVELGTLDGSLTPWFIGYLSFIADAIERIATVFPALFITVTALTVYMTITRLVTQERSQIGCLATLGYSRTAIVAKYLPFTAVSTLLGAGLGLVIGHFVVSPVIFQVIQDLQPMPTAEAPQPVGGYILAGTLVGVMLLMTFCAVNFVAVERPAALQAVRAPKTSSNRLFEVNPKLWARIPYRYKSTFRNVLRYRMRFVMTVIAMLLSTALVFCGLALNSALRVTNPELIDAMGPIVTIIVVAAILLGLLVLYTITNINIEERAREIATLKVLGYKPIEVAGYVFREILVLTAVGVALGLPTGYLVVGWMFDYLQFGGLEYVPWYTWFLSIGLAFVSLGFADLMLFRKLLATDMNASLKSLT
jgi:putative ABC transport system permease protein